jgi:hypothetical protein
MIYKNLTKENTMQRSYSLPVLNKLISVILIVTLALLQVSSVLASSDDTVPPEVTIALSPSNPSNESDATFEFFANDDFSSTFHFSCKLDGMVWEDCSSDPLSDSGTKSYSGLSEGSHTFQLNAIDEAGNDLSPNFEKYTWTIDLAPAVPTVTAPQGVVNDQTPTISGTAEAGSWVNVWYLDG